MRRATQVFAITALVATACGSRVSTTAAPGVAPSAAPGGELTLPSSGAPVPLAPSGNGGTGSTATGSVGGGTSASSGAGGTGAGGGVGAGSGGAGNGGAGSGGGTGSTTALGPGITGSTISLAVAQIDAGPANEQAAGQPISADARLAYNAMAAEVNAAGGILGRDVEPIYYRIEGASVQTVDQQAQSACAHWTQDNEVFAFLWSDANGVLQECAKKAGAIVPLPDFFFNALPEDFQRYPNFYEISGLDVVRAGQVTVTGLQRQGFLSGNPKLGIVLWDDAKYVAALERGFLPALKKAGIEPATAPARVAPPQTLNDLAATSADVNGAVLRFQTEGITHVLLMDGSAGLCGGACLGTLFMRRSEQQLYRPRYGFNTNNVAKEGLSQGLYPAEQLGGSVAVEWSDLDETYDEGWRLNGAREACFELMRKRGVPLGNINQRLVARTACEQLWFMIAVARKMNGPLNAANFTAAVGKIGSSFQSPQAYSVRLSPTQHAGVAAARNMQFEQSCGCYKWVSDPYPV